jgi:hypothetical protein
VSPRPTPTPEELFAAAEEVLLRQIAAAKEAGDRELAETAMHVLLYKHETRMRRRVGLRLPEHLAHHEDTVATWVLERVMRSALKLDFKGESVGEWVNWYGAVIKLQVISFFRTAQGQAIEQESAVVVGARGENNPVPTYEPVTEHDLDRTVAQLCHAGVVQDVLAAIENPMHVAVIHAAVFDDRTSADIAAEHATSANNVDRIKTRFREALREELLRRGVAER